MKALYVFLLIFFARFLLAVEIMAPLQLQVSPGDRAEVTGYSGNIQIIPVSGNIMSVEIDKKSSILNSSRFSEDWNFILNKNNGLISVKVVGPYSKDKWNEMILSNGLPPFHLIIKAPVIPMEVNWQSGNIVARSWKSKLFVTLNEGSIKVFESAGDLDFNLHDGEIFIQKHKGSINIDGYSPKISLSQVEGDLNIINFKGGTFIKNIEGQVSLDSYGGDTQVADVKGNVNFNNGLAPVKIERVSGAINGRSGQGPVYLTLGNKADVKVRTEEGMVSMRAAHSGAWVNLGSNEGSLFVPNFLKLTRYPSLKIRRGRLKGNSGGRIFVRTQSGDIRLR